jgi:TonB family protein
MQPGERYRAPSVRYKINENGTVTNVKVLRYSGVKDIDQRLASSISNLKYAPRPGCPTIVTEMTLTIDWTNSPE